MDAHAGAARTTELLAHFRALVPPLDASSHKGQRGRVLVVGGSALYTGAPYFAAAAALRGGAELATVVCAPEAAPAIKAYSPELMVHAGLQHALDALPRAHAAVVGPGLGRDAAARRAFEQVLGAALRARTPLVVDADALWMLAADGALLQQVADAERGALWLTPNKVELERLLRAAHVCSAAALVRWLNGNAVVVAKGAADEVAAPHGASALVRERGALKRAGGQGDLLAGLLATFAYWARRDARDEQPAPDAARDAAAAAVGACVVTRRAARHAFERARYAFLTSDALPCVGDALLSVLEDDDARERR